MKRKLKAKAILHRMIEKYGFILYDIEGKETDLLKDIKLIIKLL